MGGPSAEHEVSLSTGRECAKALRVAGFEVVEVTLGRGDAAGASVAGTGDRGGAELARRLAERRPDVVFNALHGRYGEDGCVQGLLEWLGLPYTHSGVLASALAMDKTRAKHAFREAGLPIVASVIADREDVRAGHVMPPPYVVKPNDEGSSVGVYIVHEGDPAPALSDAMPARVMVEAYAPGREMTTTVMGDRALAVTEIVTDGWYDYDAKYAEGGSRHVIPAAIPAEITAACLDYALRAHRALGCRGLSRTDFRWDESRGVAGLVLLETNTQPGMTPTSLAPEQAAHAGIAFPDLCRWMVEDALCRD